MIEEGRWLLPPGDGRPAVVGGWKTALNCGCAAIVGYTLGENEPSLVALPCSKDHVPMMRTFNEKYAESIEVAPEDRPAIEVAEEILTMVSIEGTAKL